MLGLSPQSNRGAVQMTNSQIPMTKEAPILNAQWETSPVELELGHVIARGAIDDSRCGSANVTPTLPFPHRGGGNNCRLSLPHHQGEGNPAASGLKPPKA
jgi:hypothetical protein